MAASSIRSFTPMEKLGEGSFATVYKVKRVSDQQIYALKKIKMSRLHQKAKENSLNQVRFLASFDSQYIVKYFEAFFDQNLDVLCIVMEYAEGGDLRKTINKHKKQRRLVTQIQIWRALIHIVFGLKILHDNKILHRDIKCENIMISDGKYKIGDMNVSKVNKEGFVDTQTGTPYYASPEVWKDEPYNQKSDIWSLGCILYEMAALRPPFMGSSMEDLYKNILKGTYPSIPKCYSNQLSALIAHCLRISPEARPSTSQLIINSTFKIYENICLQTKVPSAKMNVAMLQTICMPKDIRELNSCLPKSNYETKNYENQQREQIQYITKRENEGIDQNNAKDEKNLASKIKVQPEEQNYPETPKKLEIKNPNNNSNSLSVQQRQDPHPKKSQSEQKSAPPIKQSSEIKLQTKTGDHHQQDPSCNEYGGYSKMIERIRSYSKKVETSSKKKRRILKQISKEIFVPLPKSRSRSLPRTENKSTSLSKQLASQTSQKELSSQESQKENLCKIVNPIKRQGQSHRRYWNIVQQAKKCLERSSQKHRRLF